MVSAAEKNQNESGFFSICKKLPLWQDVNTGGMDV
jgi:hypothetical protein